MLSIDLRNRENEENSFLLFDVMEEISGENEPRNEG